MNQKEKRCEPGWKLPSVWTRAVLFVSRETLGYAALAERHEAGDKNWSYYGKSDDQTRSGIWVPLSWWEDLRTSPKTKLITDDRPPAKEIDPFDDGGKSHAYADDLPVSDSDDEIIFGV